MSNIQEHCNKVKKRVDTVRVCIRVRPLLQYEDSEYWAIDEAKNIIYTNNSNENYSNLFSDTNLRSNQQFRDLKRALMDSMYSPQSFSFDKIYSVTANSQLIYKESCRDITKSVLNGFNCSIFMYGQTTSGKTFTMLGSPNSPGILPCSLRDVFHLISKEPQPENYTVLCSYVEIYNENIHDLLTDANYLKLIEDSKYGVVVAGAKRVKISSFEDGIAIKDYGEENRKYRETLHNEYSSRSHTIFQIFIESVEVKEGEYTKSRFSCLNLVDLAGSERVNEYDSKAEGSGETGYINKSLFVLANVIQKLSEAKKGHIPYRDSKLTRLLSQALGGRSLTVIICTVSPAAINYYQTLSTLRFGLRAKVVKLKPEPNEYLDIKAKLEYYKSEIKRLKSELESRSKQMILSLTLEGVSYPTDYSKYEALANSLPEDQKALIDELINSNKELVNQALSYKGLFISERERYAALERRLKQLKQRIRLLKGVDDSLEDSQEEEEVYDDHKNNGNSIEDIPCHLVIKPADQYPLDFAYEDGKEQEEDYLENGDLKKVFDCLGEDDVIDKIHSGILFHSIEMKYDNSSEGNKEHSLTDLNEIYKAALENLEEAFENSKSHINAFFKKKIQEKKNTDMDIVKLPKEQLPITQITNKHKETLQLLREQHNRKLQSLEELYSSLLKTIPPQIKTAE